MKQHNGTGKVEGHIASHGLVDWWLTSFTSEEQKYIDEQYQPIGAVPHTLTQGKISSSSPASQFLSELATWFRSPKDLSIAERLHQKIDELGRTDPVIGVGCYSGRHFTTYVWDIENFKRSGDYESTENLLIGLVAVMEAESTSRNFGVAPWYYEELAKLYRKQKEYDKEVAILERFAKQQYSPGVKPSKLMERLHKAKKLLESKT